MNEQCNPADEPKKFGECVSKCMSEKAVFTPACGGCFGEMATCPRTSCMADCGGDSKVACIMCLSQKCIMPFRECTGFGGSASAEEFDLAKSLMWGEHESKQAFFKKTASAEAEDGAWVYGDSAPMKTFGMHHWHKHDSAPMKTFGKHGHHHGHHHWHGKHGKHGWSKEVMMKKRAWLASQLDLPVEDRWEKLSDEVIKGKLQWFDERIAEAGVELEQVPQQEEQTAVFV